MITSTFVDIFTCKTEGLTSEARIASAAKTSEIVVASSIFCARKLSTFVDIYTNLFDFQNYLFIFQKIK